MNTLQKRWYFQAIATSNTGMNQKWKGDVPPLAMAIETAIDIIRAAKHSVVPCLDSQLPLASIPIILTPSSP
jgi:hypothetical protein